MTSTHNTNPAPTPSSHLREFGDFVARVRTASGLSQTAIQERGGPSPSSQNDIEHGRPVSETTMSRLFHAYRGVGGSGQSIEPVWAAFACTPTDPPVQLSFGAIQIIAARTTLAEPTRVAALTPAPELAGTPHWYRIIEPLLKSADLIIAERSVARQLGLMTAQLGNLNVDGDPGRILAIDPTPEPMPLTRLRAILRLLRTTDEDIDPWAPIILVLAIFHAAELRATGNSTIGAVQILHGNTSKVASLLATMADESPALHGAPGRTTIDNAIRQLQHLLEPFMSSYLAASTIRNNQIALLPNAIQTIDDLTSPNPATGEIATLVFESHDHPAARYIGAMAVSEGKETIIIDKTWTVSTPPPLNSTPLPKLTLATEELITVLVGQETIDGPPIAVRIRSN